MEYLWFVPHFVIDDLLGVALFVGFVEQKVVVVLAHVLLFLKATHSKQWECLWFYLISCPPKKVLPRESEEAIYEVYSYLYRVAFVGSLIRIVGVLVVRIIIF